MHYFIDGYNLMFRRVRAGNELQIQREHLIRELDESASFLELDITVVFDAQYQLGLGYRTHYHQIEICYTDEGETADDYILKELKRIKNPQQETVVTSDKRLAWQARRRLAKTETVEQFLSWVGRRSRNKVRRMHEETIAPVIKPPVKKAEEPETEPRYESDNDRWLRIFEDRFKNMRGSDE